MAEHSTRKIIGIAFSVCLVCSLLVSATVVGLKSKQVQNQQLDKLKNILIAGGLFTPDIDIQTVYESRIDPELLNLNSGMFLSRDQYPDGLTPESFELQNVLKNKHWTSPILRNKDMAGINVVPKWMVIYQVLSGDSISRYILPIVGKGLWSTMYGFLALDKDLRTIQGITFYQHGETPGLGGEVDNPRWKAIWVGKQAFDVDGNLKIQVIKGQVDRNAPEAKYQIDGLSGSTLTTRGVDNTVRFWLGESGYGLWIQKMRMEEI